MAACLALSALGYAQVWDEDSLTPEIALDGSRSDVECRADPADLDAVFEAMRGGPGQAVACVQMLEEAAPDWHRSPGAVTLVDPFVDYLLGDGTARGLQRHGIFIDLLGHLEDIAPAWRQSDAVTRRLPQIILASTVEDPWVADFWATTLEERVENWRETDAVEKALPALYQRGMEEAQKPADRRNLRPEALLRELSWPRYAKLWLATRVFDSWAKGALLTIILLGLVYLAVRRSRRKKPS